ncbi:MAG: mutL [Ignavibacteria bacterium]|nr:mutL [Ignavibacteria bacterium]
MNQKYILPTSIINILPDFIANQIAAGEVVQRPESVVKELVENSIDAGADSVAVVVRDAGKSLIHIVDNGDGMSKPDLELSVKRHATSKIYTSEDLEKIMTLGFRGEALASITAISQLEIRTRRNDEQVGWRLMSEPLNEIEIEPFATEKGTQVFVKNLFYNVPARRKFLHSNLTEFRHISETMLKFALSFSDKSFTYYDGNSLIFNLKPEPLITRISNTLGEKVALSLMEVGYDTDFIKIRGYIGKPHLAKQSRTGQYFFLNGRSIQSRSLAYSVFSAFEHLLEKNYQPVFVIFLEINPEHIDVNVHPQKHEVKFDDERFVFSSINKAVAEALSRNNLMPSIKLSEHLQRQPFESHPPGIKDSDKIIVDKTTGEILDFPKRSQQNYSSNFNYQHQSGNWKSTQQQPFQEKIPEVSAFDALFGKNENVSDSRSHDFTSSPVNSDTSIWQLHNKYIFAQTDLGLLIIDQHAAHERVLYERALKAMNREFAYAQNLLFPIRLKFSSPELSILKILENDLFALGFTFTIIGETDIELRTVPQDVKSGSEENALLEILTQFEEEKKIRISDNRDSLAASYSCKAAIKTGDKLTKEEMVSLFEQLFNCSMPYVCPHGRPVALEQPLADFDKQFKRT